MAELHRAIRLLAEFLERVAVVEFEIVAIQVQQRGPVETRIKRFRLGDKSP